MKVVGSGKVAQQVKEYCVHTPRLQVHPRSGHIQGATNECISKGNSKSMWLPVPQRNKFFLIKKKKK